MGNKYKSIREEWIKVEENIIPEGEFIVTNLIQNSEGTKIILDDEVNVVEIFFDGVPVLIRTTVEGARMYTWGEAQKQYDDKSIFRRWFYFCINNSKLISWIKKEACGFYDEEKLKHFAIVTSEEIVDIVATFEPIIKVSKL